MEVKDEMLNTELIKFETETESVEQMVFPKIEEGVSESEMKVNVDELKSLISSIKSEANSIVEYDLTVHSIKIKQEATDDESYIKIIKTEDHSLIKTEYLRDEIDLPIIYGEVNMNESPCSSGQSLKVLQKLRDSVAKKKRQKLYCPVCSKDFVLLGQRRRHHISSHFKKSPVVCNFCGTCFSRLDDFIHHCVSHRVKVQKILKFKLDSKRSNTNLSKQFRCEICSKLFTEKQSLHRHLVNHIDEDFKCDICFKSHKYYDHLLKHRTLHSAKGQYQCQICSKSFVLKEYLKHFKLHSENKPYKCKICSKSFKQKYMLIEHLLVHSGFKPFKCEICSKVFRTHPILKVHLLVHTNAKAFQCQVCSKSFKYKRTLKQHSIVHDDKKKLGSGEIFPCDICSALFKEKWHLSIHLLTHSNDVKFIFMGPKEKKLIGPISPTGMAEDPQK